MKTKDYFALNPDISHLKESATLKINQKAKEARKAGKKIFHFGFGQSPFPVHPRITEALCKNADKKEYLPTLGHLPLRQEIARYYKKKRNYTLRPQNILIGPGSKELIFQALFVLQGPVIIPSPSWVSYGPQVNVRGKHITRVLTKMENSYKMTSAELEAVCMTLNESQKILILNNPSNPTGAVYNDTEIRALVRVCKKHQVIVISDEIYGEIDFTGKKKRSFFHYYPEGTLITGGLSKVFSAGGYRLGFLATSSKLAPVIQCLKSLVSETFSAVSAPVQYAAVEAYALHKDVEDYVKRCNVIHEAAGNYLWERFKKMGLRCPKPQGAFYLFPSFEKHHKKLALKHKVNTAKELSKVLFDKAGVALLPGCDFYYPKESFCFRVATVDYDGAYVLEALGKRKTADRSFVEKNCPMLKLGCDSIENFLADL